MQMVRTIVNRQLIFLTVQDELTFSNTVAITADQCTEEWFRAVDNLINGVMTLDNVCIIAILVRNHDGYYGSTIVGDCHFSARFVLQDEQVGLLTFDNFLKIGFLKAAQIFFRVQCVYHSEKSFYIVHLN